MTEAPSPEHVGQRLAGAIARQHRVEVGDHALRRPARRARRRCGRRRSPPRTATAPPGARRRRAVVSRQPARCQITRSLGELPRTLVGGQRGDDVVEVAGEDFRQAVHREADAVVGQPVLLEVVGADLLAPPAAADLRAPLDGPLGVALALGGLEQPSPQHLHRPRPVLQLAALVLHRHDDPARHVRDAHRRVGGVDALTAGPARAEHVDLEVLVVDRRPRPRRPRAARARSPTTCGCAPGSR